MKCSCFLELTHILHASHGNFLWSFSIPWRNYVEQQSCNKTKISKRWQMSLPRQQEYNQEPSEGRAGGNVFEKSEDVKLERSLCPRQQALFLTWNRIQESRLPGYDKQELPLTSLLTSKAPVQTNYCIPHACTTLIFAFCDSSLKRSCKLLQVHSHIILWRTLFRLYFRKTWNKNQLGDRNPYGLRTCIMPHNLWFPMHHLPATLNCST